MKYFLVLITLLTSFYQARGEDYCLSIRGNGELAPAHWGAMASVVEKLGLPRAQAGGSSASISIFLLDSIASSDFVKTEPDSAAFFIKTLEGTIAWLKSSSQWQDLTMLVGQAQSLPSTDWSQELSSFFSGLDETQQTQSLQKFYDNLSLIERNISTGQSLGLINHESFLRLMDAIEELKAAQNNDDVLNALKKARFFSSEVYKTYEVFGKFNAESDHNLFFRAGLIDFDGLATQVGRIGGLYAKASNKNPQWSELYKTCSTELQQKIWSELVAEKPICQNLLVAAIENHFQRNDEDFSRQTIGQTIVSFPITSVLTDSAYSEALQAREQYLVQLDSEFGKNFRLSNPNDVQFGYWGDSEALREIRSNLDSQDAKSRRFLGLGEAPWNEALRLSPAEPGLSPLKEFQAGSERYLSAGGWPDLTPTLILKAYGCTNVVHITRRGGESLFAQGIAKRLLNLEREWDYLRTTADDYEKNWVLNNRGDTSDLLSDWAELYNVAQPQSSLKKSIAASDAILCTDWNLFSISDSPSLLIEQAYRSPFYVNPDGGFSSVRDRLQPHLSPSQSHPAGYPEYVGCVP